MVVVADTPSDSIRGLNFAQKTKLNQQQTTTKQQTNNNKQRQTTTDVKHHQTKTNDKLQTMKNEK